MMIFNDGRQVHGEALPATTRHGTIHPAGGIDNHQQGWRTRHPIATTKPRTICNPSPIPGYLLGIYPFLGGMGREPKKTPPLRPCPLWRCFAATRSAFVLSYKGQSP